jgi:hypothetical protein
LGFGFWRKITGTETNCVWNSSSKGDIWDKQNLFDAIKGDIGGEDVVPI